MIRLSSLFWLALVLISGFAMFKVKYSVQDLEDELGRMRKQTVAEQQEIRVLNAEWSYLTQPERLAELNRKFLSLTPIPVKQLQQKLDEIPLRPPAPPPVPAPPPIAVIEAAAPPPPPEPAAPAPDTVTIAAAVPVPAVTTAALKSGTAVRLAKASATRAVRTLNDLFEEIGGDR